jgi:hypothetical protein
MFTTKTDFMILAAVFALALILMTCLCIYQSRVIEAQHIEIQYLTGI